MNGDVGEAIGQFDRMRHDDAFQVDMGAEVLRETLSDERCTRGRRGWPDSADVLEESPELRSLEEKRREESPQSCFQSVESGDFVLEKVLRLDCIAERIVPLVRLQFLVLQELVIGLLREQQGGCRQRIDQLIGADSQSIEDPRDESAIVLEQIVPAKYIGALEKGLEGGHRTSVEPRTVRFQCTAIDDGT